MSLFSRGFVWRPLDLGDCDSLHMDFVGLGITVADMSEGVEVTD